MHDGNGHCTRLGQAVICNIDGQQNFENNLTSRVTY